jgi:hypothetical protein
MLATYKKKETDIIVEWGAKHAVFTPAVHQHESVLDNHCFGILKGALCSAKIKKDDRIVPSVFALIKLDSIKPATIKHMWDRNLFLQDKEVDLEVVKQIIKPRGKTELGDSDWYNECRDRYHMDVLHKGPKYSNLPPKELESGLDGTAWQ